ncbi:tyrosine-type recombinase/integrase [Pelotomaculum propionicicum]|uniref:Tyrosine recombinase XerC n=1 Tax=Pelotomaculum propionicicum TaxID=258475 RepID=A0A4Y7RPG7_9FIRM|nr:tyrosine-type recombinase/integrase [Pelotomaculum propionicicum]NLI14321.1 tyrosine-type recombinase/integrase [Peptococcaceae bacterium]TEB10898.1 Tyrosine recombinase XerC [Pelotomaculum propionicicum]
MKSQWNGFQSPLADGIQQFLAAKRALGQSFNTEEYALRSFDAFLCQQKIKTIEDITAELVDDFIASRPRKRPRSYNHLISVMGRLFSWLTKNYYLDYLPLRMQPRRETSKRIPFLFTPDMARDLLACAGNLPDSRRIILRGHTYRTIFALLYGLGLRVGEVCRLCLSDVDLNRSLLVIRQTKFYKSRLVPYGPRMKELLTGYLRMRLEKFGSPRPEDPLFTLIGGRPINRHTIDRVFSSLVPQMGLKASQGVSPPCVHDLRHSFAVGTLLRWYRSGIDPQTRLLHLSTFLGHVSPTSTAVYLTITPDLLQEANLRFEKFAAPILQEVLLP